MLPTLLTEQTNGKIFQSDWFWCQDSFTDVSNKHRKCHCMNKYIFPMSLNKYIKNFKVYSKPAERTAESLQPTSKSWQVHKRSKSLFFLFFLGLPVRSAWWSSLYSLCRFGRTALLICSLTWLDVIQFCNLLTFCCLRGIPVSYLLLIKLCKELRALLRSFKYARIKNTLL